MNKKRIHLGVAFACLLGVTTAQAATITLAGTIKQNTQDSGSPAMANTSLNSILDGDPFTIVLNIAGDIGSVGNFSTNSLSFLDAAAAAQESAFVSGEVVLSSSGGFSQFSVLGCLIDTASCATGNQLALEFQIPTAFLTSAPVVVQQIPGLLPMDLLEDGGATDIQGTLTSYSYARASQSAPEPSAWVMLTLGSAVLLLLHRNQTQRKKDHVR